VRGAKQKGVGVLALALALIPACSPSRPQQSQAVPDLERLLPDLRGLVGWRVARGPVEYGPANLYEYLDGGAERYVGYGFSRLLHVRYQRGDDNSNSVTLDIFDMGSEPGAFGIYSSVRPTEAGFQPWGVEGYRSGSVAAAWKGRVFVHVEADSEQPPLIEILELVVRGVCERVEGTGSPPSFLAALPSEGLVAWSQRYVAADLLGHECLPGGVVAAYAVDGERGELFFSDLGNEAGATSSLAALRAHYQQSNGAVGESLVAGSTGFSFRDSMVGTGAVLTSGRFVAGVHGTLSAPVQKRLLETLAGRLAALSPVLRPGGRS